MHMSLLTPHGSHKPKHPSGNTAEHASANTPLQREEGAATWEEGLPWLQLQWHGATWHLRQGCQTTCSTSRLNLIWREKKEISHVARGIYHLLRKLEQRYNFFPKIQKLHRAKKRDLNIPPLYIQSRSSLEKSHNTEKERTGGKWDFSFFCLLCGSRKLLLVTVLLHRPWRIKQPKRCIFIE